MEPNAVWKVKKQLLDGEKDMKMLSVMFIVRQSKVNGIGKSQVWRTFLKNRWSTEILKTESCLTGDQVEHVIIKTAEDLNLDFGWNLWIPDEDLAFGMELYTALFYCPQKSTEAAKLSFLFEHLLVNHSLNTVVAATMHNIQPRASDNIEDFTAINIWYRRLSERYNFSLGSIILPLLPGIDSQEHLETLDPPFLPFYNDFVSQHQNTNTFRGFGM